MKKLMIMAAIMMSAISIFAAPHNGRVGHGRNAPPRERFHECRPDFHRPPPPPPHGVRTWIPSHTVITINALGIRVSTVIPGHWEFR